MFLASVDPYGFERGDDFDYATFEAFEADYLRVLARRSQRWSKMVGDKQTVKKSATVKRYVRKGVPQAHRPMVWMCVTGAKNLMEENKLLYKSLLAEEKSGSLVETITIDLHRTFPDNIYFQEKDGKQSLMKPLFNVLSCFAHYNKETDYCQGLNYVAAMMLIVLKDEEKAFWLLYTVVTKILPDYYTPLMKGLQVDMVVLARLAKEQLPEVATLMEAHRVDWTLVCMKWFLCLYVDVLPNETVMRIWDCLFFDGSKVLFRVALYLVKRGCVTLLSCTDLPQIIKAFQEISKAKYAVHCHEFVEGMCKDVVLKTKRLEKLRMDCKDSLAASGSGI